MLSYLSSGTFRSSHSCADHHVIRVGIPGSAGKAVGHRGSLNVPSAHLEE